MAPGRRPSSRTPSTRRGTDPRPSRGRPGKRPCRSPPRQRALPATLCALGKRPRTRSTYMPHRNPCTPRSCGCSTTLAWRGAMRRAAGGRPPRNRTPPLPRWSWRSRGIRAPGPRNKIPSSRRSTSRWCPRRSRLVPDRHRKRRRWYNRRIRRTLGGLPPTRPCSCLCARGKGSPASIARERGSLRQRRCHRKYYRKPCILSAAPCNTTPAFRAAKSGQQIGPSRNRSGWSWTWLSWSWSQTWILLSWSTNRTRGQCRVRRNTTPPRRSSKVRTGPRTRT
mmetsp:Transcript_26930/g.81248  ORF Transcript_26930/g.81248 Transcript_26930/m.81248 type:complete len:280 (+) Transcript_26930:360-1199(+)